MSLLQTYEKEKKKTLLSWELFVFLKWGLRIGDLYYAVQILDILKEEWSILGEFGFFVVKNALFF